MPARPTWGAFTAAVVVAAVAGGPVIATAASLIDGKNIKRGTVASKQIRDRGVAYKDIATAAVRRLRSPGPTGPAGARGPGGPAGPQGAAGAPGASAFGPVPAGTTVTGLIAVDEYGLNPGNEIGAVVSLKTPVPLTNENVMVDSFDELGNVCTGSEQAPTAPPGFVCIYVGTPDNVAAPGPVGYGAATLGFGIEMEAASAGSAGAGGTWAYTAPG